MEICCTSRDRRLKERRAGSPELGAEPHKPFGVAAHYIIGVILMSDEKKKLVVDQEILDAYLRRQRNSGKKLITQWVLVLASAVLVIVLVFGATKAGDERKSGRAMTEAVAAIIFFAFAATYTVGLLSIRFYQPEFALIDKWVRITCEPASDFPVSPEQKRYLAPWAADWVRQSALLGITAFRYQERSRNALKGKFFQPFEAKEEARKTAEMDEEVKKSKGVFFETWDFFTSGDNGIDVLVGQEWSDPNVYLKKVEAGELEDERLVPVDN